MFKRKSKSRFIPKARASNKFTPRYRHHFRVRTKILRRTVSRTTNNIKVILTAGIISFGLVFGAYKLYNFLFMTTKFNIKNISVEGLKSIPEQKFYEILPVKPGDNLFKTYFMKTEKRIITEFPVVKTLSIRRDIPDTIRCIVTERKPVAWLKDNSETRFVDNENVCFTVETSTPQTVPYIEVESDITRKQAVQLLDYLKCRKNNLYLSTLKLYNVRDRVTLVLNDNTKIFWGFPDREEFEAKLDYLEKTLKKAKTDFANIEYIDLKLFQEGRIVVKPREARWQEKN
ncbi:MAG: FtsQ-type POTRA domain-containing protein [Elusimicrobia bacterium]|nr:FtsQ-type POTRA domain-containing protein [Elusimicrobiota bacterium]